MSSSLRQRASTLVTTLALGAALMSGAAEASVLYSQAPNPAGQLLLSVVTTENAESFKLGYAANISAFRWYGTDVSTSSFSVRLYSGSLLTGPDTYSTQSGPGATLTRGANPVLTINSGGASFPVYEFELTLASALTTVANQEYYLAIFSSSAWGWLDSTEGDGTSAFRAGTATPWEFAAPDLSLAVIGDRIVATGVPEPTSLALVSLALVAAGGAFRRKA